MYRPSDYTVRVGPRDDPDTVADSVGDRIFRTDLSRPGFALLEINAALSPEAFRETMLALCEALGRAYRRRFDRRLLLLSASRFDQQVTTEPHLDGGPDESVLVLGYEPTEVQSRLFLIDYSRAANDRGLTPKEFLARFNPMARPTGDMLAPYATEVGDFDSGRYRIVVINNSSLGYDLRERGMLGVLHKATVIARPEKTRFVDSIMLRTAEASEAAPFTAEQLQAFVTTGAYLSS